MIYNNHCSSGIFVQKQKTYTAWDSIAEATAMAPCIVNVLRKGSADELNNFNIISPKFSNTNNNPLTEYKGDMLINYQMSSYNDNRYYDSGDTIETHYNDVTIKSGITSGTKLGDILQDMNFCNPHNSEFRGFLSHVFYRDSGTIKMDFPQIIELIASNISPIVSTTPDVFKFRDYTISDATDCVKSIKFNTNEILQKFPSKIGCAIIFSATNIPDYFAVGYKGGTAGHPTKFFGKFYQSNGPYGTGSDHLKDLGNNFYLFYDDVIDNVIFRYLPEGFLTRTKNTSVADDFYSYDLKISPPVILGMPTLTYIDGGNTATNTTHNPTFSGFNFISVKTYIDFGAPAENSITMVEPNTAKITPRYASNALVPYYTVGYAGTPQQFGYFHSDVKYSQYPNYGYAGFDISHSTTKIAQWGDVKYIENMDGACDVNVLTTIPSAWGNWQNLTGMNRTFADAGLTGIPSSWEGLGNVKNLYSTFTYCKSLTSIPSSWVGLNSVSSMSDAFGNCSSLQKIPNSWEGISTVKNMSHAFGDCNITSIPNSWNGLSNVSSTNSMFRNNHNITTIPTTWEGLDSLADAGSMFSGCTDITNIPTDLFEKCPNLSNMQSMFADCTALTSDIAPILDGIFTKFSYNITKYGSAFMGCTGVKSGTNTYQDILNDPTPLYPGAPTTKGDACWKPLFGVN